MMGSQMGCKSAPRLFPSLVHDFVQFWKLQVGNAITHWRLVTQNSHEERGHQFNAWLMHPSLLVTVVSYLTVLSFWAPSPLEEAVIWGELE